MSVAKRNLTGALSLIFLLALLPAPAANAACYRPTKAERAFVRKMNRARENAGKAPLRLDREVSKVSKVHTKEMVNEESLFHTSTTVLSKRVTNWVLLGENVGVGGNVSSLHQAFMNSPAHKANILLGSFKHVGVGVMRSDDRMWVTVTFEAKSDPGSPLC